MCPTWDTEGCGSCPSGHSCSLRRRQGINLELVAVLLAPPCAREHHPGNARVAGLEQPDLAHASSLPNNAPWFVGYTENPLGIRPCGRIIDQPRI